MFRLALRGMGARKLRTALTAMAIVLGEAGISGTYVLLLVGQGKGALTCSLLEEPLGEHNLAGEEADHGGSGVG